VPGQDIIILELGGIKVDIAAGLISEALVKKGLDHMDIVWNAVCGGLHDVGRLDAQVGAVGKKSLRIKPGDLHDGLVFPPGSGEHLILARVGVTGQVAHVRDVHDAPDVVPGETEELLQHILHDVAAQVANMGIMIDGRPTRIEPDRTFLMGDKRVHALGECIIKTDRIRHVFLPPWLGHRPM